MQAYGRWDLTQCLKGYIENKLVEAVINLWAPEFSFKF